MQVQQIEQRRGRAPRRPATRREWREFRNGYTAKPQSLQPAAESPAAAQAEGPAASLAGFHRGQFFTSIARPKPPRAAQRAATVCRIPPRSIPSRIMVRIVAACRRASSDCAMFCASCAARCVWSSAFSHHPQAHPQLAHLQMRDEAVRSQRHGFAQFLHGVLHFEIHAQRHAIEHAKLRHFRDTARRIRPVAPPDSLARLFQARADRQTSAAATLCVSTGTKGSASGWLETVRPLAAYFLAFLRQMDRSCLCFPLASRRKVSLQTEHSQRAKRVAEARLAAGCVLLTQIRQPHTPSRRSPECPAPA